MQKCDIGHTFCHFPCLPLKPKDEITSIHRHSPMIFRSGNQEKSLDGDKVTLLHWVIYSHFEAHTTTQTWSSMSIIFLTNCRGPLWIFLFFLFCVWVVSVHNCSHFLSFSMNPTHIQRWNHINS